MEKVIALSMFGGFLAFISYLSWQRWRIDSSKPNVREPFIDLNPRPAPKLATLKSFKKHEVVDVVLEAIRTDMSLYGNGLVTIGDEEDARLVKTLIEIGYLPQRELALAVHKGICNVGREMFEWHRVSPLQNHPDHALSTEALGYAMKHGALSSEEMASIRFDHGETPEKYIKSSEGLFEKVMQQIRDGTAFFDLSGLGGNPDNCHDVCCT